MEHRAGNSRLSGTSSRLDLMASRAGRTISQPGVNVTATGQLAREVACDAGDPVLVSGFEACRALFSAHFWNIQLSLSPVGTAATKIVIVLPCATSASW
jgi:hypothetical protein